MIIVFVIAVVYFAVTTTTTTTTTTASTIPATVPDKDISWLHIIVAYACVM